MVKCEDCANSRHIAAGDVWYCEITADENSRGAGSGEIKLGETIYKLLDEAKEAECDEYEKKGLALQRGCVT